MLWFLTVNWIFLSIVSRVFMLMFTFSLAHSPSRIESKKERKESGVFVEQTKIETIYCAIDWISTEYKIIKKVFVDTYSISNVMCCALTSTIHKTYAIHLKKNWVKIHILFYLYTEANVFRTNYQLCHIRLQRQMNKTNVK